MFGLNRAEVIGRLGADVTVNHLTSGGRVANMSIATDESYLDRNSGDRQERTEWHRIVTFQPGLIDMLEKHATKGRLVYVSGTLQTRRWRKDGEESDRFSTEIRLAPGGRVQFLDKPNGANGNGTPAAQATGSDNGSVASGGVTDPAPATQDDDDIPF
ncbi:single-stranded DNA-binding protein [Candidatus Rariloculus sp.]|uniref:single-stranded DNA-binding protein n=1 Tax=Candidatus Rariloculus sp. TaxID=3101265 RepID=UPI003D14E0A4